MREIKVKRNPLGIAVFADGNTDIENMPEEQFDLFVSSLESRINEYLEKSNDNQ